MGPFHFGAPDWIVANVTKDDIWVREGILPDYPNSRSPQLDFDSGQLVVPHPPTSRVEIQEPFVRDIEIPPEEYYPDDYHPELLTVWPVDSDLVIPWRTCRQRCCKGWARIGGIVRPTRSTSANLRQRQIQVSRWADPRDVIG